MISVYNQFLRLMHIEKSSLEKYCKELTSNLSKVIEIRSMTSREKKCTTLIISDLLNLYEEVLVKRQDRLKKEIANIETYIISPLANTLRDEKQISEKLSSSKQLVEKYFKRIKKIQGCKKAYFESYDAYEKNVLYDMAINKVVENLTDDSLKKPNESFKLNCESRENEYVAEVKQFNDQAPSLLSQNDKCMLKCSNFIAKLGLSVKEAGTCAINYHLDKIPDLDPETRKRFNESLDKIDPLLEISSWIQNAMNDESKIEKLQVDDPKTFFTENINPGPKYQQAEQQAENGTLDLPSPPRTHPQDLPEDQLLEGEQHRAQVSDRPAGLHRVQEPVLARHALLLPQQALRRRDQLQAGHLPH
jgi:hypothetical protein